MSELYGRNIEKAMRHPNRDKMVRQPDRMKNKRKKKNGLGTTKRNEGFREASERTAEGTDRLS